MLWQVRNQISRAQTQEESSPKLTEMTTKEINTKHLGSMLTFLMPVEEDALSFQDQNYVFWIWPIYHLGRLCAQKLICFINFFKHILQIRSKSC